MVGLNPKDIAGTVGHSKNDVQDCLRNRTLYEIKKSPGRPPKLTLAMTRRLTRAAANCTTSSNSLHQSLHLQVSFSTVRQTLNESEKFKLTKKKHAPLLTAANIKKRKVWTRK